MAFKKIVKKTPKGKVPPKGGKMDQKNMPPKKGC